MYIVCAPKQRFASFLCKILHKHFPLTTWFFMVRGVGGLPPTPLMKKKSPFGDFSLDSYKESTQIMRRSQLCSISSCALKHASRNSSHHVFISAPSSALVKIKSRRSELVSIVLFMRTAYALDPRLARSFSRKFASKDLP